MASQWGKFWIAYDGFDLDRAVVIQFRKVDMDAEGQPSMQARQSLATKGYNRLLGTFKSLSAANDRIRAMSDQKHRKNPMKYPARKPKYKFQEPVSEYKYRRTRIRKTAIKKKTKRFPRLSLKSEGTRDAIYDYRRGYRDPDYPMSHFEDHTYASAYREAMRKMIARKGK